LDLLHKEGQEDYSNGFTFAWGMKKGFNQFQPKGKDKK